MTDQQDSTITPPPELREQWQTEVPYRDGYAGREHWLIERAAQWGYDQRGEVNEAKLQQARDQELEACCEWLRHEYGYFEAGADLAFELRAARRPKPQTLSSIALQMLDTIERDAHYLPEITDTIRRALEALPDD